MDNYASEKFIQEGIVKDTAKKLAKKAALGAAKIAWRVGVKQSKKAKNAIIRQMYKHL